MKKKILVIEDERATRINLLGFLESEGFEAIGAENGCFGVEAAQKHLPNLIICDVLMPEMDGYDVLTQLQSDPVTATIPFIFLTMETEKTGFRQSMEMGADDYLSKPVTSERLRRAIASRLRKQEALLQSYALQNSPEHPDYVENNNQIYGNRLTRNYSNLRADLIKAELISKNPDLNPDVKPPDSSVNLQELQEFIEIKDQFFERLFHELIQTAARMNLKLSELKGTTVEEKAWELTELEREFAKILALSNQGAELQRTMTPQNAQLLQQFNFFDLDRS